jgi:spore coat polysaccharide biosynthesis protein SpsF (cytidylyltransferase family)
LLPLGRHSVLGNSFLRAKDGNFFPILCTSDHDSDDALVNEAINYGVPYFRGDLLNKIKRWSACAVNFNFNEVHIIDGDDPFFDCDEIWASVRKRQNENLDLLKTSKRSDAGFASVGFSTTSKYLRVLADRTDLLPSNDLDVIPWNLIIKDSDRISTAQDSYLISDRELGLRLTLDYPEDLELLNLVLTACGENAKRISIENYLNDNRQMIQINYFRNSDFLSNKVTQLYKNFNLRGGPDYA